MNNTATKTRNLLTTEQLDIAQTLKYSLNSGVESIYQWVRICTSLADTLNLKGMYKDAFLTACDFDMVIGHYDWRFEMVD